MQLEQIGKYKILEKIGQGAMGEVYKAHDSILNRLVAVKTISASLAGDDTLRKRFQREAQSAARLNHPNIITVYDFGEEQDKIYMAMELLEGNDLKQAIASGELTDLDQKLFLMGQICDGLAFAHQNDVVHRDLKPANIHLQPNGQVKIMDFGLARLGGSEMTRTGMVMGTPHYMSPEQVRGERADARSDVFALGCVFYEMLSGRKPFDADSMHAVLFRVMQEDPEPLSDIARDVPFVLMELTERALEKDRANRFQDAGELRAALQVAQQAIAEGRGEEPLPPVPRPIRPEVAGPRAAPGTTGPGPGSDMRRGPGSMRADRSAARSGSPSAAPRARSRPPAPTPAPAPPPARRTRLPLILAVAGVLVTVAVAATLIVRWEAAPQVSATASTRPPAQAESESVRLARQVAATQVETARKKLEAGDYKDAARRAEGALKLDPNNKDAREILNRARSVLSAVEAAAAAVDRAAQAGEGGRTADALWALMLLDPGHPLVGELAGAQETRLKDRVPEARGLMTTARSEAESAKAGNLDSFREAVVAANAADAAAKNGQVLVALRQYVEARDLFSRASRSVR